jgi:hypothetical protein
MERFENMGFASVERMGVLCLGIISCSLGVAKSKPCLGVAEVTIGNFAKV